MTLPSKLPSIIALTGGGLAREAGFAPFDPATLPTGLRLEDVLTPDAFRRNPTTVRGFYNRRRRELLACQPSAAHEALAALDALRSREVLVVTRNIDDLHERAGSQAVIHTHGELLKAQCLICTKVSERYDDITAETACPVCGNAGHLRPHIVWVGEEPLGMAAVYQALAQCRLLLVIGIPSHTEPVRGFIVDATRAGARTVELNAELHPDAPQLAERFPGSIAETLPAYARKLAGVTSWAD
ncbi:MAG: NAD-dependent protein deacylase [Alphaproteobacteria bacterium]|nr:NAD-dependent protein deacylase [Alphaproteobacteria bacterium]